MLGNLYIITNDVNSKVYIGKTYKSLIERWKGHERSAFAVDINNKYVYKTKFYNALRKYGPEHFKIELIARFEEGILEQKEIEYISKYDSYNNGYNSTLGGDGNRTQYISDNIINYIIKLYKEGNSIVNISKLMSISRRNIREIIVCNNINILNNSAPITVIMYDIYWNTIKSFKSISDAYEYCKKEAGYFIDSHAFFRQIHKSFVKGNICYGYRWQRLDDLIYKDMIFITIFDKKEYINGNHDIKIINGIYYVDKCKRPLSGNDTCKYCGGIKLISKEMCKKCNRYHKIIKDYTCNQCGAKCNKINADGLCSSCYNVAAKGKSPKPSKEELQALLASGLQKKQIAKMYGRTDSTIHYWIKSYNLRSHWFDSNS